MVDFAATMIINQSQPIGYYMVGLNKQKDLPEDLVLTSKRLESYPPKTWTIASATNSGLSLSIIVSIRVIGEASNPAKKRNPVVRG